MKIMNYKSNIYKYVIYVSLLLIFLFVMKNVFYIETRVKTNNTIVKSVITFNNENTTINVDYPRFQSDKINKIITDYIYNYIKEFKANNVEEKVLDISYDIYKFDIYTNIVFNIESSISDVKKSNILLNILEEKEEYITSVFEEGNLIEEIDNLASHKYATEIYENIMNSNVNNHTYVISQSKVDIYFDDVSFYEINFIPYITIILDTNTYVYEEESNNDTSKKYISFTFDDGPSKYTSDMISALELNNSSATFFMLGNKMKYNKDIVTLVDNSNSEVASHTYSHKYLTKISKKDILNEINSVNTIYNEITGKKIKYVRPPYGSYNDTVLQTLQEPLILWNIDPKDWLVRNSNTIYKHIVNNACDGCIIVMHDTYKETLEAVKKVIPKLHEMGYEVVSISKLSEIKNVELQKNKAIRSIK